MKTTLCVLLTVLSTAAYGQESTAPFIGKWRVIADDGKTTACFFNLRGDGTANKSHAPEINATWEVVGGTARISWEDGWRAFLETERRKTLAVSFKPGQTWDDPPYNVQPAEKVSDIDQALLDKLNIDLSEAERMLVDACLRNGGAIPLVGAGEPEFMRVGTAGHFDLSKSRLPPVAGRPFDHPPRTVNTVWDEDEMLIFNNGYWVEGLSTQGLVDGSQIRLRDHVSVVVGTKSYITTLGTKRTVKRIAVIDPARAKEVVAKVRSDIARRKRESQDNPVAILKMESQVHEERAASKLNLAEQYLRIGSTAKAHQILQDLIQKYPDTESATTAQELLTQ